MRPASLIIGGLSTAFCIYIVVWLLFFSPSDPATRGFDFAAVWVIAILFAATTVPVLFLASARREPRSALGLAIAFPSGFVLAFLAPVAAFM